MKPSLGDGTGPPMPDDSPSSVEPALPDSDDSDTEPVDITEDWQPRNLLYTIMIGKHQHQFLDTIQE